MKGEEKLEASAEEAPELSMTSVLDFPGSGVSGFGIT